ncbi:MAG: hypothetical protein F6K11_08240 [Leptolyngbya sp. SIO3F4]|nr:hypothetical protein [Leptolyngbya sp. SIO3F4]
MRFTPIPLLAAGFIIVLGGCGSTTADLPKETIIVEESIAAESDSQEISTPVAFTGDSATNKITEKDTNTQTLVLDSSPDPYCYMFDDGIVTTHLRLTVNEDRQIYGDAHSTVQNDEAAYYTSYIQLFEGPLVDNQATVNLTTWIEYDVQNSSETWTLTGDTLQLENYLLNLTDCDLVNPVFQDEDGLEARDLVNWANNIHTQRVEFAPGASSATLSNSVIRGDRDVYILGASGGQQMELSIESLESNAVFDVISPSQLILAREAMDEVIFLPHTGDYQVVVGGTRGNASYDLTIGIQ